jgi:hypothetical protein
VRTGVICGQLLFELELTENLCYMRTGAAILHNIPNWKMYERANIFKDIKIELQKCVCQRRIVSK